jgi:hypothetical protein
MMIGRDIPPHKTRTTALVEAALLRALGIEDAIGTAEAALHPHRRSGAARLIGHLRHGRIVGRGALGELEAPIRMTEPVLADAPSERRCTDMTGGTPVLRTVYADPAHDALDRARGRLDRLAAAIRAALASAEAERIALRLLDGDRELTRTNQPRS